MSLQIVPARSYVSSTQPSYGAPSAPGVHDTLRSRLNLSTPAPNAYTTSSNSLTGPSSSSAPTSSHPLEARLKAWRSTQDALKMQLLRRQFGLAEPVKRSMELSIVRAGEWRPACLGSSGGGASVHSDVLSGRDWEMDWEDVFVGEEMGGQMDFHVEMEARMGMAW